MNKKNHHAANSTKSSAPRTTRHHNNSRKKKRYNWKRLLISLAVIVFVLVSLAGAGGITVVASIVKDRPDVSNGLPIPDFKGTTIYPRKGDTPLYEYGGGDVKRESVKELEDISPEAQLAIIAVEDWQFYEHGGYSLRGLARALWGMARGQYAGGGSTITQQLIRNSIISNERTVDRKLNEIFLAVELENYYKRIYKDDYKDEILKDYLNAIPYGGPVYGIQTATETFWGIDANDISLAQAAFLAAIPNAPTYYSPHANNLERIDYDILKDSEDAVRDSSSGEALYVVPAWKNRQTKVLYAILERWEALKDRPQFRNLNINEKVIEEAILEPLGDTFRKQVLKKSAPHFVDFVQGELIKLLYKEYGYNNKEAEDYINRAGLTVRTTLDWDMYQAGQAALDEYKSTLQNRGASNAALVAIDPPTGELLVMIGSYDYTDKSIDGEVNVAISPYRQMGSAMKPLVYAYGFEEKGYVPASMIADVQTTFPGGYTPRNYAGTFSGPLSIRENLGRSLNIAPIKMVALNGDGDMNKGVRNTIDFFHTLGITTMTKDASSYGPAIALGSGETRLLDLTYAYSVFANGGTMAGSPIDNALRRYRSLDPVAILDVLNAEGESEVPSYEPQHTKRVIKESTASLIWSILSDNEARSPAFGANSALNLSNTAAKTGTSTNEDGAAQDATTFGYHADLAAGVWVGNNDGRALKDMTGSSSAALIWNKFMRSADRSRNPLKVTGVESKTVCKWTVTLPDDDGCESITDLFPAGYKIDKKDDVWEQVLIDKQTSKRAAVGCPEESVEERFFITKLAAQLSAWQGALDTWINSQDDAPFLLPDEKDVACTPPGADASGISIAILSPEDGETYEDTTLEAKVTVYAADPIAAVSFYLDGQKIATERPDGNGSADDGDEKDTPFDLREDEDTGNDGVGESGENASYYHEEVSILLEDLENGEHQLVVNALTKNMDNSNKTVTFTVENTNAVSISSPKNNAVLNDDDIELAINVTVSNEDAVEEIEYKIDAGSWKEFSGSGLSLSEELDSLRDGEHTILVRVRGDEMRELTATSSFVVDTRTPDIELTVSEEDGIVSLRAEASDTTSGVSDVVFYAGKSPRKQEITIGKGTLSGKYFTTTWEPGTSGTYYITAVATDKAGNTEESASERIRVTASNSSAATLPEEEEVENNPADEKDER